MVKSYSKTANHNMRRPVVKEDIVRYMRTHQKQNEGYLAELEAFAHQENIPIIQHEVVAYFRFLMQTLQPKNILEIGTAIGFSALLMAENAPDAKITTLDRNPEMIAFAKENFAKYDTRKQITLLEGDAVDTLSTLEGEFDFVFMDAAKAQYIHFLPEVMRLMKKGAVLITDNVLQEGDIIQSKYVVRRRDRTIHKRMREYLEVVKNHPELETTIVPIGDGITISVKK